jgi:hypothetical protein
MLGGSTFMIKAEGTCKTSARRSIISCHFWMVGGDAWEISRVVTFLAPNRSRKNHPFFLTWIKDDSPHGAGCEFRNIGLRYAPLSKWITELSKRLELGIFAQ